jgi:osmotically-inducible protein OsmY
MPHIAAKSDAQIQADVLDELQWDPRVDSTEVAVRVRNGVATLTGTVESYAMGLAAGEAARRVYGVVKAANKLVVQIPGPSKRTDAELAKEVRQALEWDVLVARERIRVFVVQGWVTLTGNLDTCAQRDDAGTAISRLAGVAGVNNEIVVAAPTVDPARIRATIERALARRADHAARRIHVTVRDGVVALEGTVHSWCDKNAIQRAASCAPGVRRIDDGLVVDPWA